MIPLSPPPPPPPQDLEASAQHLFHGNGYNRWFDKCHQLICTDNGVPGANVEHSSLDATIMCQLWEYVLASETFDSEGHVLEPKPGTTFDTPAPYQYATRHIHAHVTRT